MRAGVGAGRSTAAGSLLVTHADKLLGAAAVLAHRRSTALGNHAIPPSDPRHGLPTGNDEADLWHRTTGLPGGNGTELPYYSIAAEMVRGFTDLGEAFGEIGLAHARPDLVAAGGAMVANATALLADLNTSLYRTAGAAAPGGCPISFVAGGQSCVVADPGQTKALQDRENEPWRTYSELMYSGLFPSDLLDRYLDFAALNNKTMRLGMLSGTGPSCCGNELQTFTSHGFGFGLAQHGFGQRFLLLLYTTAAHACTRGTWVCGESSSIDRAENTVAYATPAQLSLPLLLKWALVFEEPRSRALWLAPVLPREWLAVGATPVAISHAPTRYGRLSVRLVAAAAAEDGGAEPGGGARAGTGAIVVTANVTVAAGFRVPPGGIKLHVRVPLQPGTTGNTGTTGATSPAVHTVTVGGRPWSPELVDRLRGTVDFPASVLTPPGFLTRDLQRIVVTFV